MGEKEWEAQEAKAGAFEVPRRERDCEKAVVKQVVWRGDAERETDRAQGLANESV